MNNPYIKSLGLTPIDLVERLRGLSKGDAPIIIFLKDDNKEIKIKDNGQIAYHKDFFEITNADNTLKIYPYGAINKIHVVDDPEA